MEPIEVDRRLMPDAVSASHEHPADASQAQGRKEVEDPRGHGRAA